MRALALLLAAVAALAATPATLRAEAALQDRTLVAARALRPRTRIAASDVALVEGATPGALNAADEAVGMEVRVTIHQGRPVRAADLAPPALVERNGLVRMVYRRGGLRIAVDGRALGRAGEGERVRVMNLDSRATVTALVVGPGLVEVR